MRRRHCRQRWPLCPKAPPELTKRPRTARMKKFWNFSAGSGCNSTPVTGEMGRESWIRAPQTAQNPSEVSADASPPHRRWLFELSACRSPTETFQRLPPDRTDVMENNHIQSCGRPDFTPRAHRKFHKVSKLGGKRVDSGGKRQLRSQPQTWLKVKVTSAVEDAPGVF